MNIQELKEQIKLDLEFAKEYAGVAFGAFPCKQFEEEHWYYKGVAKECRRILLLLEADNE